MKLKYKKIIMLTTMSTMGIGLLTLSVSQDRPKAEESLSPGITVEASLLADNGADSNEKALGGETTANSTSPSSTPTPTTIPTPTEVPVYKIEVDAYPEIDSLFVDYYAAKSNSDVDKLKSILSDPSKVESLEQLQSKTEYIEDYRKIKTYTKKSLVEGTYIVYVYHEIKFTSVNTPAPALSKFYLVTGEDNKLKIFSGEMDDELKAYFDMRSEDKDVIEIIEMTNKKGEKAKAKDEDLLNFWENIDKMAGSKKETSKAEGDTE